jgi:hypothetical protein
LKFDRNSNKVTFVDNTWEGEQLTSTTKDLQTALQEYKPVV